MEQILVNLQKEFLEKIDQANSLALLDELFLEIFGKNGKITQFPKEFSKLSSGNKKTVGPFFNQVKQNLEKAVSDKRNVIREESYDKLADEESDLTKPVKHQNRESFIHPINKFEQEIAELFAKLGFQLFESPQIDTDHYNFEALNIPSQHPARDLWDTLYIKDAQKYGAATDSLLLRTHTSNSQVRIMEKYKPPIRMMVMGRCFRYENLDARHEHTFDQFELVYVDKGLSMANLQYLSEYFLKSFLGKDIKIRLSPGYYPFTEPSVHIFGTCVFCKSQGCKICGGTGELELGGAGMIHPNVLKNGGIDPNQYSGIAWGPGLERILMLKYGVKDLRLFRSGDLKFLQKIGRESDESK